MKLAIVSAVQAFFKQAKQNHLDYCRAVVKKADEKLSIKKEGK